MIVDYHHLHIILYLELHGIMHKISSYLRKNDFELKTILGAFTLLSLVFELHCWLLKVIRMKNLCCHKRRVTYTMREAPDYNSNLNISQRIDRPDVILHGATITRWKMKGRTMLQCSTYVVHVCRRRRKIWWNSMNK